MVVPTPFLYYDFLLLRPCTLVLPKHWEGISSVAQGRPPEEAGGSCELGLRETQERKMFGK